MNPLFAAVFVYLFTLSRAQQAGTLKPETKPILNLSKCTKGGVCTTEKHAVTIDANWRWLHHVDGSTNCYTGNTWDASVCSDGDVCAAKCALDGADYEGTYGITSTGDALTLKFVTGPNVGSRVYLMNGEDKYALFQLKNQEFSFDVDVSNLPCGLNGALYFTQMDEDGGTAEYPGNKAGAKFGTGYCDAQCPRDPKFIAGKANVKDWVPSKNDNNTGTGSMGACCAEMDIWEANSISQAFTPHTCKTKGYTVCQNTTCGDSTGDRYSGLCDMDGCDYASYRLGAHNYYGPQKTVDTTKKFTVVTQFHTDDRTANGTLTEITRLYVQNGKVIKNSVTRIPGVRKHYNSITDAFCKDVKAVFGDPDDFAAKGGLKSMGSAMDKGMVLALSLWDDHTADMLWLDSNYPTNASSTKPGVARGTCDAASGDPKVVEAKHPDASVIFSNIKIGPHDTTYSTTGYTTSGSGGVVTASGADTSKTNGSTRRVRLA